MNTRTISANRDIFAFSVVFLPLVMYWAYLGFVTQPVLIYDALGYEGLGRMLYQQGWKEYFVSGPNREPFYPWLVSLAMRVAPEDYIPVLKCFQIGFLFLSTWLIFKILSSLRVDDRIRIPLTLYAGISPALVNSSLSVYSEIVTYPFTLGIVMVCAHVWRSLRDQEQRPLVVSGVGLGILFLGLTMCKSIYEAIFPMVMLAFMARLTFYGRRGQWPVVAKGVSFVFCAVLVFGGGVLGYKMLNKIHNGNFVLTDRAAWALYGSTARRVAPVDLRGYGAGMTYYFLGEPHCSRMFSPEQCQYWDVKVTDRLAEEKVLDVIAHFPEDQVNQELLRSTFARFITNPVQYVFVSALDWLNLFFWESTRIGFVVYPDWLDRVYDQQIFAQGLRLFVGALSLVVVCYLVRFLITQRNRGREDEDLWSTAFWTVYLVFWHVTLYSLFTTVSRFTFPVAQLILLMWGLMANISMRKKHDA